MMTAKPEVVILACQQALPEAGPLVAALEAAGLRARAVPEPCSSKIEAFHLLRILALEADVVWVLACPEDACLLREGSYRLGKRLEHAREVLREIGLEPERLELTRLSPGEAVDPVRLAAEMAESARTLGLNPGRRGPKEKKEHLK